MHTNLLAALSVVFCLSPTDLPAEVATSLTNVVMVHGILNTGKIFDPMCEVLKKQGCDCFAPSLTPNDCRHGVHALALQLSADVNARFGKSQPIFLVGFSMGGLITRDYVQDVAAPDRVRGVFLISTPEHGTLWASLAPDGGVKELSFNSPFIKALNKDEQTWKRIPVCSYWTPYDLMVLPATSSRWPVGENKEISCLLHPWMARNHDVIADIAARLAALRFGK